MDSSLVGRNVLITGANTGIGEHTAYGLAARGARVVLAGRSEARTVPVLEQLRRRFPDSQPTFLPLDLADLDSVDACVEAFLALELPLHVLVNNAGVAALRGLTKSGFEMAFGINHVGHFALTLGLLPKLIEGGPSRIVTVASRAHVRAKKIPFEHLRAPTRTVGMKEYGVSKLCNILFSRELGRRLEGSGVTTYSLHPGVVASDIWRQIPWPLESIVKLFMISNEEGAETSIYCAADPELADQTGLYYDRCAVREPTRVARDDALAKELWEKTAEWTGRDYPA